MDSLDNVSYGIGCEGRADDTEEHCHPVDMVETYFRPTRAKDQTRNRECYDIEDRCEVHSASRSRVSILSRSFGYSRK
jgi:hypothetical protein